MKLAFLSEDEFDQIFQALKPENRYLMGLIGGLRIDPIDTIVLNRDQPSPTCAELLQEIKAFQ